MNVRPLVRGLTPGAIVFIVWLFWPSPGPAIPAFARKYGASCSSCHVAIPKLNAFGVAFRNNGYRIPEGDKRLSKIEDVELGAEPWKDLWPRSLWPGAIPGALPIAARIMADAHLNPSSEIQLDFDMPHEVELLIAGTAGEGVSFLAHVDFLGDDSVVQVERAFIQLDSIVDQPLLNVKVGRFEVGAVPFSRFHRRLTATDYLPTAFRPFDDALRFRDSQDGIELWGTRTGRRGGGFEYHLGVVNGGRPGRDTNGAKDWYYRVAYKFGGYGLAGPPPGEQGQPAGGRTPDNWRDDSVRLGVYGYRGELAMADGLDSHNGPNSFDRFGVDLDLWFKDLNIYGTWLRGREFKGDPREFDFDIYMVEADYVLFPWLHPLVRFEHQTGPPYDQTNWVLGGVILLRANLRLVSEVIEFLHDSGDSRARFRLDLVF